MVVQDRPAPADNSDELIRSHADAAVDAAVDEIIVAHADASANKVDKNGKNYIQNWTGRIIFKIDDIWWKFHNKIILE